MSDHTIVTCTGCRQVWDMDMMAEACTCDDLDASIASQVMELVDTDDWRAEVDTRQAALAPDEVNEAET